MSGVGLKLDSLVHNLKELQQEKAHLEHKLTKLQERRRELQSTLDTVNLKFMQETDKNNKMKETLKVAEHKVTQTQVQASSLETSNQEKRERISALNSRIEEEKEKQLEEVRHFKDDLTGITAELQNAKSYYSNDRLDLEIAGVNSKSDKIATQVNQSTNDIERLSQRLYHMRIQQNNPSCGEPDQSVSIETRIKLWEMLGDEDKLLQTELTGSKLDLQQLKDILMAEKRNTDVSGKGQ